MTIPLPGLTLTGMKRLLPLVLLLLLAPLCAVGSARAELPFGPGEKLSYDIFWTFIRAGTATRKGVVGYDLTRLIIGSEGTLGVITGLTLKLLPHPASQACLDR